MAPKAAKKTAGTANGYEKRLAPTEQTCDNAEDNNDWLLDLPLHSGDISLSSAIAPLGAVVEEIAAEDERHRMAKEAEDERHRATRQRRAAALREMLRSLMYNTEVRTADARTLVASGIARSLDACALELTWADQPCSIGVTGPNADWAVLPHRPGAEPLALLNAGADLEPLDCVSAASKATWQDRVAAGRGEALAAPKNSARPMITLSPADPFTPLIASEVAADDRAAKERLAEEVTETVRGRLRSMPHETVDDRRAVCRWLNQQARSLGLRVKCPNTGAESTVIVARGGGKSSRFVMSHYEDSREVRTSYERDFEKFVDSIAFVPASVERVSWGRLASSRRKPDTPSVG